MSETDWVASPVKPGWRHLMITSKDVEIAEILDLDPSVIAIANQPLPVNPFTRVEEMFR